MEVEQPAPSKRAAIGDPVSLPHSEKWVSPTGQRITYEAPNAPRRRREDFDVVRAN